MRSRINFAKFCFLNLLIAMSSCKSKPAPESFTAVTEQEIYDVVNAVVKLNRLDTINFNKQRPLRIIDTLENNRVSFLRPVKKADGTFLLIPPIDGIAYQHLLKSKTKCFSNIDSTFFVYQNQHPNRLALTSSKFNVIPIINSRSYDLNLKKHIVYSLITLSIPVFSKDHNKAYIQSGFHCGGLCGYGFEYFLIKVGGHWQIKSMNGTWIA
jgi:hypothetical protein